MLNEKLTKEYKENMKLLICNFIDSLCEDDKLMVWGSSTTDLINENKGKKTLLVNAEKVME